MAGRAEGVAGQGQGRDGPKDLTGTEEAAALKGSFAAGGAKGGRARRAEPVPVLEEEAPRAGDSPGGR